MPSRPRLMPLEVLHRALVLLGLGARLEGAEIAMPAGLRVDLARIKAIAARLELADHDRPPLARGHRSHSVCCASPAGVTLRSGSIDAGGEGSVASHPRHVVIQHALL